MWVLWLDDCEVGSDVDFRVGGESEDGAAVGEIGQFVVVKVAVMTEINIDNSDGTKHGLENEGRSTFGWLVMNWLETVNSSLCG